MGDRIATTPAPRGRTVALAAAALIALAAGAALYPAVELATAPVVHVRLGSGTADLTVADTPLRRAWGLQGRASLQPDHGMLFVFDPPRRASFVRATVPFPVDLVFVDAGGRVIGLDRLDAARARARAPGPARFVLELPSGWASDHGLATGTPVTLSP